MTVVDAIKKAMKKEKRPMNTAEIYKLIIENGWYIFLAKEPKSIVNAALRRHCFDLDFPSASPVKHFYLVKRQNGKNYYYIKDSNQTVQVQIKTENISELLPEEKMLRAYKEHFGKVKNQLLTHILGNDPAFFEALVVKLLVAMGYGYDTEYSGVVVGKPHDSGIDGIIYEDKLGLGKIYIQAKRYSLQNNVSREELQRFVGAMQDVQKGVFITSSDFTKSAAEYAQGQQQKFIKLINGNLLAELMIQHQIGALPQENYVTYRVDTKYFEEN